ncbi:hypothetical protein PanWU01x14_287230 [Parasponia andersonii]|uniref:Uncharacterized protein n=1 Tax=Parasponia andersonii TaxID=3476 RepID=A0A2P5AYZ4_PARAD|nr:hypothetical protein PanWU01x14_287230 [Parasponia andersonii]
MKSTLFNSMPCPYSTLCQSLSILSNSNRNEIDLTQLYVNVLTQLYVNVFQYYQTQTEIKSKLFKSVSMRSTLFSTRLPHVSLTPSPDTWWISMIVEPLFNISFFSSVILSLTLLSLCLKT